MKRLGKIQSLHNFCRIKSARPKCAQAKFRRFKHHRRSYYRRVNFAAVLRAAFGINVNCFRSVLVARGLFVANREHNRRVVRHRSGVVNFLQRGLSFQNENSLRLRILRSGRKTTSLKNFFEFFFFDGSLGKFPHRITIFAKFQKIHIFILQRNAGKSKRKFSLKKMCNR